MEGLIFRQPPPQKLPAMIVAFAGWPDAAEAATGGLAGVAWDEDEDQEIRNAAIFALSQRPTDEGLPILMELARTGAEAATRRTAIFWLAQSGDDRVVPFFEEILLAPVR